MITCRDRDEHASSMIPRIITIVVISAGPMEVRGPLLPHTLQWPKAGPGHGSKDGVQELTHFFPNVDVCPFASELFIYPPCFFHIFTMFSLIFIMFSHILTMFSRVFILLVCVCVTVITQRGCDAYVARD